MNDDNNDSPLYSAWMNDEFEIVRFLIKNGADVTSLLLDLVAENDFDGV